MNFFVNAFNQNVIHEFLAFEDVKFKFYPYGCNLYVICNNFSLNINNIRALKVFLIFISILKNKKTL